MKVVIWHNLLWSRYKGLIFSALHRQAEGQNVSIFVHQIAETEGNRAALSPVDLSAHRYPHDVLFAGNFSAIDRKALLRQTFGRVWREKADVTVLAGFERPEYWLQALALKVRGRKFALFCDSTIHDSRQTALKGLAKRLIFGLADGIFCYGQRSVEYVTHYGADRAKAFAPCQAAALPADYAPEAALARRLESAALPGRFLYVGRLSPEKGIDTLLRAFAALRLSMPDAELRIVGTGPEEAALQVLAAELKLDASVVFAGAKSSQALAAEYLAATALLLPSRSEPWGLVVNEALSWGCPAIVSDRCGCVPELIRPGTGLVVNVDDIAGFTEAMYQTGLRSSDREQVARRCIETVARYTPDTAAATILAGLVKIGQLKPAPSEHRTSMPAGPHSG